MVEDNERSEELHDMLEDVIGHLEDSADSIEKASQVLMPGVENRDVSAYREIVRKARALL